MLWLLVACGCPTFDEMEVTDRTGTAEPALIADIEAGLVDFARWTGREGVCVPRIAVVEDADRSVDPDAGYGGGGWSPVARETAQHFGNAGGHYRGDRKAIFIAAAASDGRGVAVHELCHAIDHREDHSADNPELFPALDWEEYPTRSERAREREAFARTCGWGALDLTAVDAVDAACGSSSVSEAYRYVLDEVYTEHPTSTLGAQGLTWTTSARAIEVPAGVYVYQLLPVGERLVLLGDWNTEGSEGMRMGALLVDPETGAVGAGIELRDYGAGGVLVADVGRALALLDGAEFGQQVWAIDLETGEALVVADGLGIDRFVGAAISGGVLYALGTWEDGSGLRLGAWDLEAQEPLELEVPDLGAGQALLAVDGGVELLGSREIGRLDAASGAWERWPRPYGLNGWYDLGDGSRLSFVGNASGERVPVRWDAASDTWALAEDPCATGLGGRVSGAEGGTLWSLSEVYVTGEVPLELSSLRLD